MYFFKITADVYVHVQVTYYQQYACSLPKNISNSVYHKELNNGNEMALWIESPYNCIKYRIVNHGTVHVHGRIYKAYTRSSEKA